MSQAGLLPLLTSFYKDNRIYSINFGCENRDEHCLKAAKRIKGFCPTNFVEAKASYVGSKYEQRIGGCRLLFLSLDPGEAEHRQPEERTPEAVRSQTEDSQVPLQAKWVHWYWTTMLALQILKEFSPELRQVAEQLGGCKGVASVAESLLRAVTPFFAHVNVVKCSLGLPGNAQAPSEMYKRSRGYLKPELPLLEPDVVITQGKDAAAAFVLAVPETHPFSEYNDRIKTASLGDHEVLWIKMHHPRNGCFFTEAGPDWKDYVLAVQSFMARRELPGSDI